MNKFEKHVAKRTTEEKRQMIADYEQFQRDGFIGGCTVRTVAREWIDSFGAGCSLSITGVMKDVVIECYRHFANEFFKLEKKK